MRRKSIPPNSGSMKELKELLSIFKDSDIDEMELEREGWKIRLKNSPSEGVVMTRTPMASHIPTPPAHPSAPQPIHAATPAAPPAPPAPPAAPTGTPITSPMVGTFYRAPDPEAPAFVQAGDVVSEGQTLCILEAMKLMNEIKAEFRCKILKVEVENGQTVEYGQTLFLVEKA